ncbi:NAD(+) synthase [Proteinivorax hydrogeniformans]|uniref:NH(3)-dependent NAD(+) synthetase n=1 Tax=Proteinivorax hydrogeniformans TaxID=1826727 RepID=A0AAU8HS80_9FIRM
MSHNLEIDSRVKFLQKYVKQAKSDGLILGISGGKDSAVVAALAKRAFPNNVYGVIMPCYSLKEDVEHGKKLCEALEVEYEVVDLSKSYDTILESVKEPLNDQAKSNIKPRLRMTTLYAIAQQKNYLVLGTGNRAEIVLGYFTKYGDGGSDVNPISDLKVHQVFDMARELNIPQEIINKPPSAGLWEGQTDEQELGIRYSDVDDFLDGKEVDPKVREKIISKYKATEHKRQTFAQYKDIGPLKF